MKGLVGAGVEPVSYGIVSRELFEALVAYREAAERLRAARLRWERSPRNTPARERAKRRLASMTSAHARAEAALLVVAGREPIAPVEAAPPSTLAPLLPGGLARGTPAQMREMLPRDRG